MSLGGLWQEWNINLMLAEFCFSFPLNFIIWYWMWFPVLYSRTLLFIHPIYNSLHLLIPNSQSILPSLPLPLAATNLFSVSVSWHIFFKGLEENKNHYKNSDVSKHSQVFSLRLKGILQITFNWRLTETSFYKMDMWPVLERLALWRPELTPVFTSLPNAIL